MRGESLYLYCAGVIYKWLLRNVLKCQVLVFCGLEEANAQNKLNEEKKSQYLVLKPSSVVFGAENAL